MRSAVLITGVRGGIGQALHAAFERAGDAVIGLDLAAPDPMPERFVAADLDAFCRSAETRERVLGQIRRALGAMALRALINNAAAQVVKPLAELTADDWTTTFNVNAVAPVLLTQALLPELERARGSVVNIASIHARLTKPGFTAYATSKAALVGATQSLAVELGGRVRVNAICPAAVDTPMLRAGFGTDQEAWQRLAAHHPAGRVGRPDEVAATAVFLASEQAGFISGASIDVDGAIGHRLHDPQE